MVGGCRDSESSFMVMLEAFSLLLEGGNEGADGVVDEGVAAGEVAVGNAVEIRDKGAGEGESEGGAFGATRGGSGGGAVAGALGGRALGHQM